MRWMNDSPLTYKWNIFYWKVMLVETEALQKTWSLVLSNVLFMDRNNNIVTVKRQLCQIRWFSIERSLLFFTKKGKFQKFPEGIVVLIVSNKVFYFSIERNNNTVLISCVLVQKVWILKFNVLWFNGEPGIDGWKGKDPLSPGWFSRHRSSARCGRRLLPETFIEATTMERG